MKPNSANAQPNLFEQGGERRLPIPKEKEQLAMLIGTLLLEIATTMASKEVSDEQDHR